MIRFSIPPTKTTTITTIARETLVVSLLLFFLLQTVELFRPYTVKILFNPQVLFKVGVAASVIFYLTTNPELTGWFRTFGNRLPVDLLRDLIFTIIGAATLFYLMPSLSQKVKLIAALPASVTLFILLRWKNVPS